MRVQRSKTYQFVSTILSPVVSHQACTEQDFAGVTLKKPVFCCNASQLVRNWVWQDVTPKRSYWRSQGLHGKYLETFLSFKSEHLNVTWRKCIGLEPTNNYVLVCQWSPKHTWVLLDLGMAPLSLASTVKTCELIVSRSRTPDTSMLPLVWTVNGTSPFTEPAKKNSTCKKKFRIIKSA